MSTKSHIHKMYETLKKASFCTKGYAEVHIQRPLFDNKNSICKISWIENLNGGNML
jgi:hypothetical protein